MVIVCLAVLFGALYNHVVYGEGSNVVDYIQLGLGVAALHWVFRRRYLSERGRVDRTLRAELYIWTISFLTVIALGFVLNVSADYSRGATILFFALGFPLLLTWQWAWKKLVRSGYRTGALAAHRVLLLGTADKVDDFIRKHQGSEFGLIISDTVVWHDEALKETTAGAVLLKEGVRRAIEEVRSSGVDEIVVLLPWSSHLAVHTCADMLMTTPAKVRLGPELIFDRFFNSAISRLGGSLTLDLVRPPLSSFEVGTKRVMDFLGAMAALALLLPVLLAVALLIKLDSRGPVLFRQRRLGFNQREFTIYKFRTMVVAENGHKVDQARNGDPRITMVGRYLRRWNLDELPQLFNVLRGEMSLVGPRPHAVTHDREFELQVASYARRHNIKPGITGWAQVNGWRGPTDSIGKIKNRVDFDLYYIDHWSLALDFYILAATLFHPKAYRNAL